MFCVDDKIQCSNSSRLGDAYMRQWIRPVLDHCWLEPGKQISVKNCIKVYKFKYIKLKWIGILKTATILSCVFTRWSTLTIQFIFDITRLQRLCRDIPGRVCQSYYSILHETNVKYYLGYDYVQHTMHAYVALVLRIDVVILSACSRCEKHEKQALCL